MYLNVFDTKCLQIKEIKKEVNPFICMDHTIQWFPLQVVTALYQLGLCRQHDKKNGTVNASESGFETQLNLQRFQPFFFFGKVERWNLQIDQRMMFFFHTHLRKYGTLFEGCFCGFPYFSFFDRWDSFVSWSSIDWVVSRTLTASLSCLFFTFWMILTTSRVVSIQADLEVNCYPPFLATFSPFQGPIAFLLR